MTRTPPISISVRSAAEREQVNEGLVRVAEAAGYSTVSAFIRDLGLGTHSLMQRASLPAAQAMLNALVALQERGQLDDLFILSDFLLKRVNLPEGMRSRFEKVIQMPPALQQTYDKINIFVDEQRPFTLFHQRADQRVVTYSVRWAQFAIRERHLYLDCWCEEPHPKAEVEELKHNISFRLEWLQNAIVGRGSGDWRAGGLDEVLVKFALRGPLAVRYDVKAADVSSELLPSGTLIAVRKISIFHWFRRDILRYGAACEVLEPESVRSAIAADALAMSSNYSTKN